MHYGLLSAAMRVLNATVFSRGPENEQTLRQGRKFLSENRLSILTVFKRSARVGLLDQAVPDESVVALAEAYMLLISLTGFLDVCKPGTNSRSAHADSYADRCRD